MKKEKVIDLGQYLLIGMLVVITILLIIIFIREGFPTW